MGDIILNPIKVTDEEVELFGPDDIYTYEVDNRPLRNLIWNDQQLFSTLEIAVDWLNKSRGIYEDLPTRLEAVEGNLANSSDPAVLVGNELGPFYFNQTNNVLKVRSGETNDWVTIIFPEEELSIEQVVSVIKETTDKIDVYYTDSGLVLSTIKSYLGNYIEVDSEENGSTANSVFGFPAKGAIAKVKTFSDKFNEIYSEVLRSRFGRSSLDEFLSVAHTEDGKIKTSAIQFDYLKGEDLVYQDIIYENTDYVPKDIFVYNPVFDSGSGLSPSVTKVCSWYNEPFGPTRGSSKDFPAVASAVLGDNFVDIVDCSNTQDLGLWMRFYIAPDWESSVEYKSGDVVYVDGSFYQCVSDHVSSVDTRPVSGSGWENFWTGHPGFAIFGTPKRVLLKESRLVVSTTQGVFLVDFQLDTIFWFSQDGRRQFYSLISDRNSSGSYRYTVHPLSITSSSVLDLDLSSTFLLVATDSGLNIFNLLRDTKILITSDHGSSCNFVRINGKYVAFSMGYTNYEKNIFFIDNVYNLVEDSKAEEVAVLLNNENTSFLDSNTTTALVLDVQDYPLILRGSSSGLRCLHYLYGGTLTWAQIFSTSRDATLPMLPDTLAHWLFDKLVEPTEVVDDLTNHQIPLVAKVKRFEPISSGGVSYYYFDGSYLVSTNPAGLYQSSFLLVFSLVADSLLDCTLISKWEGESNREWRVDLTEDGRIKLIVFDAQTGGSKEFLSTPVVELGEPVLVLWNFDGDSAVLYINGNSIDLTETTNGDFVSIRDTGANLYVGALFEQAPVTKFVGKMGLVLTAKSLEQDKLVIYSKIVAKHFMNWLRTSSTRLVGDKPRVLSLDSSFGSVYVACDSSGSNVSKVIAQAGIVEPVDKEGATLIRCSGSVKGYIANGYSVEIEGFSSRWLFKKFSDFGKDGVYFTISGGTESVSGATPADTLEQLKLVDGSGSGLDADLLDGLDSSQFVRSDEDDTLEGNYTITGDLTINGSLSVGGLIKRRIRNIDANYSTLPEDMILLIDASNSDITITLQNIQEHYLILKRVDKSSNKVKIKPSSGTIDGADYVELNSQYDRVRLACDGNNWYLV